MSVRDASVEDVERMVELAAQKRAQYEQYSPVFWRPAPDARESHRSFFANLVRSGTAICLVHETANLVEGFLIANVVDAPPVYDPGGKACVIDDFVVGDPSAWATAGAALRDEAERRAAQQGAVFSMTFCGQADEAKRRALLDSGSHVASELFIRELAIQPGSPPSAPPHSRPS